MKPETLIPLIVLVSVALIGMKSCISDETRKGFVGGVSYEEIAGNRELVHKAKEWERIAGEIRP
jgi:hypothetical protein